MLNKILSLFQQDQIKPLVLSRKSAIPIVILRDSAMRSDRVQPVYGRLA